MGCAVADMYTRAARSLFGGARFLFFEGRMLMRNRGYALSIIMTAVLASCIERPLAPTRETDDEYAYYFASSVVDYGEAPGQFVSSARYKIEGNTHLLLGPPTESATDSVVSLGMAGGYVTLQFDVPIENGEGYDFIVYGNAFAANKEPGVVWVMEDENGNGIPDDAWRVIKGSHITNGLHCVTITYLRSDFEHAGNGAYYAERFADVITFSNCFLLPLEVYRMGNNDAVYGYCDVSRTTALPEGTPAVEWYTRAETGGGDAIDISDAVDPETLLPVPLRGISWVKIVSAQTNFAEDDTGDYSTEVDAVARRRR